MMTYPGMTSNNLHQTVITIPLWISKSVIEHHKMLIRIAIEEKTNISHF